MTEVDSRSTSVAAATDAAFRHRTQAVLLETSWPLGDPPEQACFQRWNPDDAGATVLFYRIDGGVLVRFPDTADFVIPPDGEPIFYLISPDPQP